MRQRNDVIHTDDLLVREVRDILADAAGGNGGKHGVVIHDLGARLVDDAHAVLHLGKCLGIEHMVRRIRIWDIDADIIRFGIDAIEIHLVLDIARQTPCGIHGQIRIIPADGHTERNSSVCDQRADRAEADHPKRLAHKLGASKLRFALFNERGDVLAPAVEPLDPVNAAEHIARREYERAEDLLLDRLGVCAGRVEHDDAAAAAILERDVVRAGAGARDGDQARLKGIAVQVGRAQDQAIWCLYVLPDDAAALFELLQAIVVYMVHGFDFIYDVLPQTVSDNPRARPRPPSAWRYKARRACRRQRGGP